MNFDKLDSIDYWMQFFMATEPNLPLAMVQEKAYNAVIASMSLREKIRSTDPAMIKTFETSANVLVGAKNAALEAGKEAESVESVQDPTVNPVDPDGYIRFTTDMLQIRDQEELNKALEEGEGGLRCAICLKRFPNLRNHLKKKHHIDPEDYIAGCNYPKGTDLRSRALIESTQARTAKAMASRLAKKDAVPNQNPMNPEAALNAQAPEVHVQNPEQPPMQNPHF